MSNHSPEAEAAFPDPEFPDTDELDCGLTFAEVLHLQRDAFDDGAASKVARQYAVTREAVIEVLESSQHASPNTHRPNGDCLECPVPLHMLSPEEIADAILVFLATPLDERTDQ